MAGTFSIYKYVKLESKGWRYARAAYHPNGKIKPDTVLVKGVNGKNMEEKHREGAYYLNFNNTWIPIRGDALEAQHQRKLKLNQLECARLSGKTATPELSLAQMGRRIIKVEIDAYLSDLELTRRPARTVQSKRNYLGDFVGLIGKEFAEEYRREDVLKYKNKLQDKGSKPKTIDTRMMAVVTFFNRWLKIKLGLDAKHAKSAKYAKHARNSRPALSSSISDETLVSFLKQESH